MPNRYNIDFDYKIIRKKNIKHIYIRIKDNTVVVTARANISKDYIDELINTKSKWIKKQLQKKSISKLLTDTDARVYLFGKPHDIKLIFNKGIKNESMIIKNKTAIFRLKQTACHNTMIKLRDIFYKELCNSQITPIVEKYSRLMKLYPNKISYRHNRSRWGSCSAKNNISLNTRLIMLPTHLIEYVVIHELAHIKHKNHHEVFWQEVTKYCMAHKIYRKKIRDFEYLLTHFMI